MKNQQKINVIVVYVNLKLVNYIQNRHSQFLIFLFVMTIGFIVSFKKHQDVFAIPFLIFEDLDILNLR